MLLSRSSNSPDPCIATLEERRLALQSQLDARVTRAVRNRLGQFATPSPLARDVLAFAAAQLDKDTRIRFLDPAVGTGAFYAALRAIVPNRRIERAVGVEVDRHYGEPAAKLWSDSDLDYRLADFTRAIPDERFNLLICNPPYVRHHHLQRADKARLGERTREASGMTLSGLAGLYCYFIGLAHAWMEQGALAGWLIPSEFMDVNYGRELRRYLLERVTLLRIHRFDPNEVQFGDALVSSAVVWFRNAPPPKGHTVHCSFGGTLRVPQLQKSVAARALSAAEKWTRLPQSGARRRANSPIIADFFRINRGLATGNNGYFILPREQIRERNLPISVFRPILPSPRYLPDDRVSSDPTGNPVLERRLFLLDTDLSEHEIALRYPSLHAYLQEGRRQSLHQRYLCRHRSPWYSQEARPAAPIVCTYLGRDSTKRSRPFRFILNDSQATAANVYLMMYPTGSLACALKVKPWLIEPVWRVLNGIGLRELLHAGRVYGGGLHKLEPGELLRVPVPALEELLKARPGAARLGADPTTCRPAAR